MIDVMQALVRRTALALDEGRSAEALSFATKVFASERTFDACDGAIQLHGALGVLEHIGVARLLRDCRVTRIFEGSNDVLLVRIGTLRLAGSSALERIGAAVDPSLRDEAQRCDRLAETIDAAVAEVRQRLRLRGHHAQAGHARRARPRRDRAPRHRGALARGEARRGLA